MRPLEAPARLAAQQCEFAAHLRDPAAHPAPAGIEERRLQVYRELFFNSLEGLLAGTFPVLRSLRGDAVWRALVRDFYREHASHTPLFPEIGREFVRYLEARAEQDRGDPPFLVELAHYEWIELALANDETDLAAIDCIADGDLLDGVPLVSPLAWPLAYRYPVHRIRADHQPVDPPAQPSFLLIVRGRDDSITFKSIDLLGFRLLQALANNPGRASGRAVLSALASEAGAAADAFIAGGAHLLAQLRERQAILGTVRAVPSG